VRSAATATPRTAATPTAKRPTPTPQPTQRRYPIPPTAVRPGRPPTPAASAAGAVCYSGGRHCQRQLAEKSSYVDGHAGQCRVFGNGPGR